MSLANKRILITGISGFVGSHMSKYLLDDGAKVFGILRRRANGLTPLNLQYLGIETEVQLIEGEIQDISSIAFALDQSKPDVIFHLAAQSYVPRSSSHPIETANTNSVGTSNLLEAVRIKGIDPTIVFAGSSEEFGLVIGSQSIYERVIKRYGVVFPEPKFIPELPINEENPLRPMSPYAVSKVYGDFLMRNYHMNYGMKTIVSRAFNHEGAGRGIMFVTSLITNQVMKLKRGEINKITIGNVNAFRDWSHVQDIIKGYCLLAQNAKYGDVYIQGSQRTNSILSYILLTMECAGFYIEKIETVNGLKSVESPTEIDNLKMYGVQFEKTKIDTLMLEGKIEFQLSDIGIFVYTDKGKILIEFDEKRFRSADVPILLSDTHKIQNIGFKTSYSVKDIIVDQLNYYMDPKRS